KTSCSHLYLKSLSVVTVPQIHNANIGYDEPNSIRAYLRITKTLKEALACFLYNGKKGLVSKVTTMVDVSDANRDFRRKNEFIGQSDF
ncbi:MAG: hypothetical protein PHN78_07745, partial [Dehalococcoidales bacterium]|nr:hypothetical protein [Dehalococcoidales bacterium]